MSHNILNNYREYHRCRTEFEPVSKMRRLMKSVIFICSPILLMHLAVVCQPAVAAIIYGADNSPSAVFRVDGPTSQTVVASGGSIVNPVDVEIWGSTGLLVSSVNGATFLNDGNGDGSLVRVDRITGVQTVVSDNTISVNAGGEAAFSEPVWFDFDLNGDIIVVDAHTDSLIRVSPTTGAQTTISSGGLLAYARAVAVESSGNFLVTANSGAGAGASEVVRVAPNGSQSLFASGDLLDTPTNLTDIVVDNAGAAFVVDRFDNQIIRIDTISGAQSLVSSGGNLSNPTGLDLFGGFLYVADGDGKIIRIDPGTGAQSLETNNSGILGGSFHGVAVIPEPPTAILALCGLELVAFGVAHRRL